MHPLPPIAAVDFQTEMVLVLGMGGRPTCGYDIRVEAVDILAGHLRAQVVETSPGPTCGVCLSVTQPAAAVAVPVREQPLEDARRQEGFVCPP